MKQVETWIDPVFFSIGPISVHWYGLMYVIGFLLGTFLLKKLVREGVTELKPSLVDTYVTYLIIGLFIGARLVYVFIYNWKIYAADPLEIFAVWKGGLSFHGGLLGLVCATCFFVYRYKVNFFSLADGMAVAAAPGLFFGRMGNFINGELYGRITDSKIGMLFPGAGPYPRHPSQLYEAVLEGIVTFFILWCLRKKVKYDGILSGLFLVLYGTFRYCIEFFREPDVQLGLFFWGTTSMGQILCLLMIVSGIIYISICYKMKRKKNYHVIATQKNKNKNKKNKR